MGTTMIESSEYTAVNVASAPTVVTYTAPTAIDDSGVTPTVVCNPAPGTIFQASKVGKVLVNLTNPKEKTPSSTPK